MPRRALLAVAVYAAVLAVNRSLVRVHGPSMRPTYHHGDLLLTLPIPPAAVRTGDVVVVADPWHDDHLVVKRVARIDTDGVQVHGDDPEHSTDSRVWGPLGAERLRRRVVTRVKTGPAAAGT